MPGQAVAVNVQMVLEVVWNIIPAFWWKCAVCRGSEKKTGGLELWEML